MNNTLGLMALLATLGAVGTAEAGTSVAIRFSGGDGHRHAREFHPHHSRRPLYERHHARYWHGHRRHHHPVVVSPVILPSPIYVYPQSLGPALSGDYGRDIADLRDRVKRLRDIVRNQKEKGILTDDQHRRFMESLEGIERDQQARSYDRGGHLRAEDFTEFYSRLDGIDEDIERALAG